MAAAAVTRRRKSTDGGGIAALPDELLLEVFSRVGNVKALFLFAVTSRRAPPSLDSPPTSLPTPGSPLGPTERALTSFVANDDGTFNYAQPLAARHGILLRHIVVNRGSCCIRRKPDIHCRLLDPVTGAHDDVAPPLECACVNHANGYAILTAADGDHINREQRPPSSAPHPAFSGELLLVGSHLDNNRLRQHVHSFSGATRRWSAPAQIRHHNRLRMVGARAAVVPRGAAHWLYADDTIDASVPKPKRPLAIKAAGGVPYLCVRRDGRFSLARVHPTRVDVWTQPDGDDGGDMVIQMPAAAVPAGANFMCCSWFQFSKGAMMAVYGGSGVFVLNLETKAIEKIMDLTWCDPSRGYYSCLPYEMDPPEFFVGRLGGRAMETEEQAGLTMRD
ncbi:hypothetical protein SETIT_5G439800v2 [Setaria italica]|uniref:F-box domain-containing protein n=1 Tax=Setaria italica TaxID=4555 RepID=A0A368RFB8_SETIT|nr:hypothetical protein SETIT_5G439800v2 [Setaria italica]